MKQKIIHLLFIATICFAQISNAQNDKNYSNRKNQFRLGVGVEHFKTLDLQFSPNIYKSTRPSIDLGYQRKKANAFLGLNLKVAAGSLLPGKGNPKSVFIFETDFYSNETIKKVEVKNAQIVAEIGVNYLQKIADLSSSNSIVYLGGEINEHLTFSPGIMGIGSINYVSCNFKTRLTHALNNGKNLSIDFTVPLLSLVTRLPYHNVPAIPGKSDFATFFTGHNQLESLNHFQNFSLNGRYPIIEGHRMSLDLSSKIYWLHYYRPDHLTQVGGDISIEIKF